MIVAMFDDFAPEGPHETAPSLLNYFLGEVKDGTVNDSSLDTAKKWMDVTGKAPYYINPIKSVMLSEHGLALTMNATYAWRVKMTASASIKSRLCASSDGRHKVSRLKPIAPPRRPVHPRAGPGEVVGADPGRARGLLEQ